MDSTGHTHPRQRSRHTGGFTLMEMMIALLILAILSLMVVPVTATFGVREQVKESLALTPALQQRIADQWRASGSFPADNAAAGLPEPDQLPGNYLRRITVADGALHLQFGNKAHGTLRDQVLSLRPLYVAGSPLSPVSWNCAWSRVPPGMQAAGENRTTIEGKWLPVECRDIPYGPYEAGTPE